MLPVLDIGAFLPQIGTSFSSITISLASRPDPGCNQDRAGNLHRGSSTRLQAPPTSLRGGDRRPIGYPAQGERAVAVPVPSARSIASEPRRAISSRRSRLVQRRFRHARSQIRKGAAPAGRRVAAYAVGFPNYARSKGSDLIHPGDPLTGSLGPLSPDLADRHGDHGGLLRGNMRRNRPHKNG